jgi:putative ABC transport system permease protein
MRVRSVLSLAWSQLTHSKPRLVLSAAGITFAVVLMYIEVGFMHAFYDSQVRLYQCLDADLILHSRANYAMLIARPFPRRRLEQARAIQGVATAYPLYVDYEKVLWKNPATGRQQPIRVVAFDPDDPVFALPAIRAAAPELKLPDTALLDARSRESYGPRQTGIHTEIAGHSIRVVGTFDVGTDFLSDGNVIMSDKNYWTHFASRRSAATLRDRVHLGVLKVDPRADPERVAEALRRSLPDDVIVQTKQQFLEQEMDYWQGNTPLGYIFGLGAALGFVVGVIICYQILYTDVADHLPQFATLKAIGFQNRFLVGVVLSEALFLALAGFLPGLVISGGLYGLVALLTGLPMQFTLGRMAVVLVLTVAMCLLSGLIALRRVIQADPAEVFG